MLNKQTIIGHLGDSPETTQVGATSVTKFSVASTDKWTDKDGNKQEHTEWFKVEAWGKLGEICAEYLVKGKQVYIEGKTKTDIWDDKEGNKRYSPKVVASNMQMLGAKGDRIEESSGTQVVEDSPPELDDIPF